MPFEFDESELSLSNLRIGKIQWSVKDAIQKKEKKSRCVLLVGIFVELVVEIELNNEYNITNTWELLLCISVALPSVCVHILFGRIYE